MTTEMPKAYDAREVEPRWYQYWEEHGLFRAGTPERSDREAYTIAIPPPNVTGSLHMGHALMTTLEDVLIRWMRMRGFDALWIPGTDHAGIATQLVVERVLRSEGKTRQDLGREKFVERVWQWKGESGNRILEQLRVMGASCDWSRTRFTMDAELSRAVREVFVRLYEEGLIYRDTRLINWCVECRTALSDLEVDTEENVQGELFEFAYPVDGGSGELVVATTRPETMLGDTAVAVHPDDPRYTHLHGRHVRHPFLDRKIPVITDAILVDPKFGTGVVKVTPAHDPNDFATGKRHMLDEINILELDGKINANGGRFAGMDRFAARKAVKKALDEAGLVRGGKAHVMTLPRCQRCNSVVEPMISTQWFVKMEPLAKPAIEVVERGQIQIVPEEWTKTYFHWMRNIQDWCISRQLWWGHEIPAWYCSEGHVTVARDTPKQCAACGRTELTHDPDVLDTWFSSALWPFSTLGWPAKSRDLERFYPTSDMETGFDILFFWVARMIVMGLHFMGDVPFRRVLLHGMVTDERGEKMSKVKGNVIDPLDVIHGATLEQLVGKAKAGGAKDSGLEYLRKTYPEGFAPYGADALRMTLLSYAPQQRKIALSIKRIEGYRNFANKLWNAARYALMKLEGSDARAGGDAAPAAKELANRWILSRLAKAIDAAHEGLAQFRLDDASGALYHFVWDELCDWYLELSKPLLASSDPGVVAETRAVLVHVLEAALRALHPMVPFITEEIWQRVPRREGPASIMVAPYPTVERDARRDPEAEREMEVVQAVTIGARTVRAEHDLPRARTMHVYLTTPEDAKREVLARDRAQIEALAGAVLHVGETCPDESTAAVFVQQGIRGVIPDVVDRSKEKDRLGRELGKVQKDLDGVSRKLGNASFVDRAPPDVVAKERERLAELSAKKTELETALKNLA